MRLFKREKEKIPIINAPMIFWKYEEHKWEIVRYYSVDNDSKRCMFSEWYRCKNCGCETQEKQKVK